MGDVLEGKEVGAFVLIAFVVLLGCLVFIVSDFQEVGLVSVSISLEGTCRSTQGTGDGDIVSATNPSLPRGC